MTRLRAALASLVLGCGAHEAQPRTVPEKSLPLESRAVEVALSCDQRGGLCPEAEWMVVFFEAADGEVLEYPVTGQREVRTSSGRTLRIATAEEVKKLEEGVEKTPAVQLFLFERSSRLVRGEMRAVYLGQNELSYDLCGVAPVEVEYMDGSWRCKR